jgi:tetratricopeptide (TPR) repeat protein
MLAICLWTTALRNRQKLPAVSAVKSINLATAELQTNAGHAFTNAGDTQQAFVAAETRFRYADRLLQQRRLSEAKQAYVAILVQDPKSARAYEGVGLALNAQGKQEDAFFYLERATDLDPQLPQAQFALAAWYLQASFKKEAARRLQLATGAAPQNAAYWHELGLAYSALEVQNQEAENAYRRAVALDPGNVRYLLDLADMLVIDSRSEEAESIYRRALTLTPDNADALSRYGGFLADSRPTVAGRQEADRLLRKAVHIDPKNDFAWYQLGRLASAEGNDRQAIAALGHALVSTPQIAEGWYALSRSYLRVGDTAHAALAMRNFRQLRTQYQERTHMAELLDLQPQNHALHVKLARLYALDGENAKAIFEYLTYLRFLPRDAQVRKELADLQAHLRSEGRLPSMLLFSTMVQSSRQHDRSRRL